MFWRKAATTKWLHVNIQLLQSRVTVSFWHQETDKGEKENFEKNSNQRFILFLDSISGSQSVSLESDQVQERTPSENSQGCPLVHYLSPILILVHYQSPVLIFHTRLGTNGKSGGYKTRLQEKLDEVYQ